MIGSNGGVTFRGTRCVSPPGCSFYASRLLSGGSSGALFEAYSQFSTIMSRRTSWSLKFGFLMAGLPSGCEVSRYDVLRYSDGGSVPYGGFYHFLLGPGLFFASSGRTSCVPNNGWPSSLGSKVVLFRLDCYGCAAGLFNVVRLGVCFSWAVPIGGGVALGGVARGVNIMKDHFKVEWYVAALVVRTGR